VRAQHARHAAKTIDGCPSLAATRQACAGWTLEPEHRFDGLKCWTSARLGKGAVDLPEIGSREPSNSQVAESRRECWAAPALQSNKSILVRRCLAGAGVAGGAAGTGARAAASGARCLDGLFVHEDAGSPEATAWEGVRR
jgi:hypothetical protein